MSIEPPAGYTPETEFTIGYSPVPQPRHSHRVVEVPGRRPFISLYIPTKHAIHAWKGQVQDAWRLVMPYPGFRFRGPLAILARFVTERPKHLIWKRKPMPRQLDERQGAAGTSSGDCDNLMKAVYDALNGVAWHDDFEVAWSWQEKWIAAGDEQPHATIVIAEIKLDAVSPWDILRQHLTANRAETGPKPQPQQELFTP